MAYKFNRGFNDSHNNDDYQSNNNNFQRSNRSNPKNRNNGFDGYKKKHTGAKSGVFRKGNNSGSVFVRGWRASKRHGLVTFMCNAYKNTAEHATKNGKVFYNWMCKITYVDQPGRDIIVGCLYYPQEDKVRIPKYNVVINPRARNGGYCGKSL